MIGNVKVTVSSTFFSTRITLIEAACPRSLTVFQMWEGLRIRFVDFEVGWRRFRVPGESVGEGSKERLGSACAASAVYLRESHKFWDRKGAALATS